MNKLANKHSECTACTDAESALLIGLFFETVSNLEHALTHAGYTKKEKLAKADWKKLGDEITIEIPAKIKKMQLITNPPKKLFNLPKEQIQKGIDPWQPLKLEGAVSWATILNCVLQVRHNLFHGEKNILGGEESNRDIELIKEAQEVLDILLSSDCEEIQNILAKYPNRPSLYRSKKVGKS